jgi:hypothetical protein
MARRHPSGNVVADTTKIEAWIEEQRSMEILSEVLVQSKAEAGRLGLYRTMHALDSATQEIGWEIASRRDPEQRRLADKYMEMRDY